MHTLNPAIKVARDPDGWTWTVFQGEAAVATGTAPAQQPAMENAWRAARSFAPAASKIYPDIIVETRPAGGVRRRAA